MTVRNLKVGYQTPPVATPIFRLSELADITLDTGASYIFRERNQRYIPIKFSVRGRDLGGTVAEAQQRIASNVKLPNGYRIDWAGEFEELQQAKKRLAIIVPITLAPDPRAALWPVQFVARQPAGACRHSVCGRRRRSSALYVSGLDFSISAAIGFISLFGVSVMNGILIITYLPSRSRPTGMSRVEAMFHAAEQRCGRC